MTAKQINLYRLDTEALNEKLEMKNHNKIDSFVRMSTYSKSGGYEKIVLSVQEDGLEEAILYYDNSKSISTWKDFLKGATPVKEDAPKLKSLISREQQTVSFCLFLNFKNKGKPNRVFAFCGGSGHYLLGGLLSQMFGIDVITRLFDNKAISTLSTGENMLSGSVLSTKKNFRKNWRLDYEDDIGKIYSSLSSIIKSEILKPITVGLKIGKIDLITCVANNTFQLKKALDVKQSAILAKNINKLLNDYPEPRVHLSGVQRVQKSSSLTQQVHDFIIDKIHKYLSKTIPSLDFDFVPQDGSSDYLACSEFQLVSSRGRESLVNFDSLGFDLESIVKELHVTTEKFKDKKGKLLSLMDFKEALMDLYFKFLDQNDYPRRYRFIDLISGEVLINKTYYFKLETNIFIVVKEYIKKLNSTAEMVLNLVENKDLLAKYTWNKQQGKKDNEFTYIQKFFKDKEYLVSHTIKVHNIELFDILKIDHSEKKIYIIHIKDGLDVKMRDLHQQVFTSTVLIEESAKSDGGHLKELYKQIKKKSMTVHSAGRDYKVLYNKELIKHCKIIVKDYTENQFVEMFKSYGRIYCAALHAGGKASDSLPNKVKNSTSNIAKQSIVQMGRDSAQLVDFGQSLKIIEIK